MAMPRIAPLPTAAARPLTWPVAGRMCGGSFTRPGKARRGWRAGCWAKSNTSTASKRSLREHRAGPSLRAAVRASESRPVVKRIERALIKLKASGRQLPQSPLGTAIDYALGQWRTLEVYLSRRPGGDRQQHL